MPGGVHPPPQAGTIAVIGIGGTGCALLPLLASLPVSRVLLIDGDTVTESNLSRQLLFNKDDIGRAKVRSAGARLRAVHAAIDWSEEFRFMDATNGTDLLKGCNLVADCTDDLNVRALIDRTCATLRLPLVSGAVHGGQVQVITRHARSGGAEPPAFFQRRPAEEQEGCDMRAVPAMVTTIAASLMALRIADILGGGHGHDGVMDLIDTVHGKWMRIMGPDAGEFMDTPVSPMRHA